MWPAMPKHGVRIVYPLRNVGLCRHLVLPLPGNAYTYVFHGMGAEILLPVDIRPEGFFMNQLLQRAYVGPTTILCYISLISHNTLLMADSVTVST